MIACVRRETGKRRKHIHPSLLANIISQSSMIVAELLPPDRYCDIFTISRMTTIRLKPGKNYRTCQDYNNHSPYKRLILHKHLLTHAHLHTYLSKKLFCKVILLSSSPRKLLTVWHEIEHSKSRRLTAGKIQLHYFTLFQNIKVFIGSCIHLRNQWTLKWMWNLHVKVKTVATYIKHLVAWRIPPPSPRLRMNSTIVNV